MNEDRVKLMVASSLRLARAGQKLGSAAARVDPAYAAGVGLAAVGLVWLAAPTLRALHSSWLGLAYSHGYLIALIVAGLIVRAARLEPLPRMAPSVSGLIVLCGLAAATLLARAADVLIIEECLLPPLVAAAVWAALGGGWARRVAEPLAYLYFAIPIWDAINETLRAATTLVVSLPVHAIGIPAYIEANEIFLPSGSIEVAGGCSGLHFFVVGLALAALCAMLYLPRWRERVLLLAVAAALSLFVNYLRVFVIVVVAHLSRMQNPLIEHHYAFGWALFALVIAPVIVLSHRLEAHTPAAASPRERDSARARPGASRLPGASRWLGAARSLVPGLAACLLLGLAWLGQRVEARGAETLGAAPIELPSVAGWERGEDWNDARHPHFVGAGAEAAAWYRRGAAAVGVYVASYPSQHQGREVVFFANRPWGETGRPRARGRVEVAGADGRRDRFAEFGVRGAGGTERLVWQGLQVAGQRTVNRYLAKLLQAGGALMGRMDAEVLVLTAVCETSCDAAREMLSQFAALATASLYDCAEDSIETPETSRSSISDAGRDSRPVAMSR